MLAEIAAPFVDSRASDLTLTLDGPREPALCLTRLELAGFEVELRVLGGSHQVIVRWGGRELSEVVACRPGTPPGLPRRLDRAGTGLRYEFESRTEGGDAAGFAARAGSVLAEVGGRPDELVGLFPGSPHAFTALRVRAEETAVRWQTWHAYPQTGELVATTGVVCAPGD